MTARQFKYAAQRFLVWREGNAVDWECTYADLAAATGLHPENIRYICKRAGWRCKFEDSNLESRQRDGASRADLVEAFESPFLLDRYENHGNLELLIGV